MSKPCILVIEDDPGISESLSIILEDEGFAVRTESNGEKGLEYLKSHYPPFLILLDIMMPVMDGFAFRNEQLKDSRLATIPVVVMTAGMFDERIKKMNVAALMRKPIEIEGLLKTIGKYRPEFPTS